MRTFHHAAAVGLLIAVLAPTQAAAQTTLIFVTSTASDGDLGGLAGADATCNSLADEAGLAGNWLALLSTTTVNAADRLHPDSGPFLRAATGDQIALDVMDLLDGILEAPILLDENGINPNPLGQTIVWTGSDTNGNSIPFFSCQDWTSNDATASGAVGSSNHDSSFLFSGGITCSFTSAHLICIGSPTPVSLVEIPTLDAKALILLGSVLSLAALAILRRLG